MHTSTFARLSFAAAALAAVAVARPVQCEMPVQVFHVTLHSTLLAALTRGSAWLFFPRSRLFLVTRKNQT